MNEVARLLHDPITFRLGLTLVHFVWQGLALGVLALVVLLALRRARPATRYLALLVLFALMAVCPVITYSLTKREPKPLVLTKVAMGRLMAETAKVRSLSRAASAPTQVRAPLAHVVRVKLLRGWWWVRRRLPVGVMLWSAGVMVLTLRLLLRWRALKRITRQASPLEDGIAARALATLAERLKVGRAVRLLQSSLVQAPVMLGWLRPAILLPPCALLGLTPVQLEAVIAHEMAHIRRHDFLVNVLQTLIETLLFYHPAVWWLSRCIRREREHCCDDLAVSACGDALSYARALAELERLRGQALEPVLAATGGSLASRIGRLVASKPGSRPLVSWFAAAMPAVALALFLLAPTLTRIAGAASLEGTLVYVEGVTPPGRSDRVTHVLRGGAEWVIPQASPEKPRSSDDFSPTTGEVIYNYGSCQDGVGIWKANPDGSDPVELTRAEGLGGINCGPEWSPDGTMIAFSHDNRMWVMNADGSGAHQVTDLAARTTGAASWSPDSSQLLACDRLESGAYEVTGNCGHRFAVDVWTGEVRVLPGETRGRGIWSPDGSMIAGTASEAAVVDGKAGEWGRIVLTDADNRNARVVFEQFVAYEKGWRSHPRGKPRAGNWSAIGLTNLTWSPSGEKIAFLASVPDEASRTRNLKDPLHPVKGNQDVFVSDVRTGRVTRITDDPIAQESIRWWE